MSDYRDVSVPAAPLRGVGELQGQLDRLTESTSAALRRVEQERDEARASSEQWCQRYADMTDERDEARDLARRLRDQLGFADSRIRTLGRELGQARAELDAERDRRGEDIAEYENACGLTAVAERERDEALAAVRELVVDRDNALSAFSLAEELRLKATAELASARTELDAVRAARDNLDRELAKARQERDALIGERRLFARSSWIVARDGGRGCERCEQEIRRGEAYELEPGTGGLMQHIHCPTEPKERA